MSPGFCFKQYKLYPQDIHPFNKHKCELNSGHDTGAERIQLSERSSLFSDIIKVPMNICSNASYQASDKVFCASTFNLCLSQYVLITHTVGEFSVLHKYLP